MCAYIKPFVTLWRNMAMCAFLPFDIWDTRLDTLATVYCGSYWQVSVMYVVCV